MTHVIISLTFTTQSHRAHSQVQLTAHRTWWWRRRRFLRQRRRVLTLPRLASLQSLRHIIQTSILGSYMPKTARGPGRCKIGAVARHADCLCSSCGGGTAAAAAGSSCIEPQPTSSGSRHDECMDQSSGQS